MNSKSKPTSPFDPRNRTRNALQPAKVAWGIADGAVGLPSIRGIVPAAVLGRDCAVEMRVLVSPYALGPRGADGRAVHHHVCF